jgi:organic hydroperoxide reductase OsmC/OhrA
MYVSKVLTCCFLGCFLGSVQTAAKIQGKGSRKKAKVHVQVHIGTPDNKLGYGLAVDIKAEGIDEELLKAGHEVCVWIQ